MSGPAKVSRDATVLPDAHAVDQVEARIAELVEARRPQLAELVRRAVDLELERLVDVELAGRNGNGSSESHRGTDSRRGSDSKAVATRSAGNPAAPSEETFNHAPLEAAAAGNPARRCRHCGESKPLNQFEQHRHVCHVCRADQQARARERRTQPAEQGDAPRPGTTST